MNFETNEVINISMEIEKSLGKLYRRFGDLCPNDSGLWRNLSQEEKIHLSILKDATLKADVTSFTNRIHELNEVSKTIEKKLQIYRTVKQCDKFNVLEDAIEIEAAKAKIHLDIAKIKKIGKKGLQAFLTLNRRSKDNLQRLKKYAYNDKKMSFAV